jgi:hypothetical protein
MCIGWLLFLPRCCQADGLLKARFFPAPGGLSRLAVSVGMPAFERADSLRSR